MSRHPQWLISLSLCPVRTITKPTLPSKRRGTIKCRTRVGLPSSGSPELSLELHCRLQEGPGHVPLPPVSTSVSTMVGLSESRVVQQPWKCTCYSKAEGGPRRSQDHDGGLSSPLLFLLSLFPPQHEDAVHTVDGLSLGECLCCASWAHLSNRQLRRR